MSNDIQSDVWLDVSQCYVPPGTHSAPAVPNHLPGVGKMVAPSASPTLKLGDIADRLGFTLPGLFITVALKMTPAGTSKQGAPLWSESDFPRICAALAEHVSKAGEKA